MNKIMTKKSLSILILLLFLIMLIFLILPFKNYISINSEMINTKDLDIKNEDELSQTFKVQDNYEKIGFLISNYQNYIKKGDINIFLYENNVLKKKTKIKSSSIIDDNYYYKYYYIKYKNNNYKIVFKFENLSDKIRFKTTTDNKFYSELFKNNEKKDETLALSFLKKQNNKFFIWYILLSMSIIYCYGNIKFKE